MDPFRSKLDMNKTQIDGKCFSARYRIVEPPKPGYSPILESQALVKRMGTAWLVMSAQVSSSCGQVGTAVHIDHLPGDK